MPTRDLLSITSLILLISIFLALFNTTAEASGYIVIAVTIVWIILVFQNIKARKEALR
jgi:hypothetical protein